jgi:hypothetical protein
MNGFWRLLRDRRNQRVLGLIAGWLVFVAAGLWQPLSISFLSSTSPAIKRRLFFIAALSICVVASFSTAFAQVKADTGSIAIGGSVTASTVIIGIPQQKVDELVRDAKRPLEELTTQQRDSIVLLKEKLDLNIHQVHTALAIPGTLSAWLRSLWKSHSGSRIFRQRHQIGPATILRRLP